MSLLAPLMRIAALTFALVLAGVAMFQDRLLYFPEAASVDELLAVSGGAGKAWPSAAAFRGLVFEPPVLPARATLLVFHGNAGHAGHRAGYAEALAPHGWRVILAEYPGYGPRNGALGEDSLVADAAATIALAQREFVQSAPSAETRMPLYLLGESLGAGVAAAASERVGHDGIAGLLLVTPWDTLANVASHHYPWLPVRWLLRDRYDSVAHLRAFRQPVLVVLAGDDRIVPATFGRALFAALPGPKALRVLAGADHNDWIEHADAGWWREVLSWMRAPSTPGQ